MESGLQHFRPLTMRGIGVQIDMRRRIFCIAQAAHASRRRGQSTLDLARGSRTVVAYARGYGHDQKVNSRSWSLVIGYIVRGRSGGWQILAGHHANPATSHIFSYGSFPASPDPDRRCLEHHHRDLPTERISMEHHFSASAITERCIRLISAHRHPAQPPGRCSQRPHVPTSR